MKFLITLIFCGSITVTLAVFFGYVEYTRRSADRCIRDQFILEFGAEAWRLLTQLRDLRAFDAYTYAERDNHKCQLLKLLMQNGASPKDATNLINIIDRHPITWQSRLSLIDSFQHLV